MSSIAAAPPTRRGAHPSRGDKLEARWHVIDTGHYPMLSTPDELTRINPQRVRRGGQSVGAGWTLCRVGC